MAKNFILEDNNLVEVTKMDPKNIYVDEVEEELLDDDQYLEALSESFMEESDSYEKDDTDTLLQELGY